METELAIVGSGPAGLAAAIEAAKTGVKVTIIDENPRPGGQLFKQIHKFFGSEKHKAGIRGIDIGHELMEQCEKLNVQIFLRTKAWALFDNGKALGLKHGNNTTEKLNTRKLILATGAIENPLAFPGWTLPGVLGAGATQTLMNLHRVLPGQRVLMVGTGNVGLIVSYQLLQAGADVVAAIDILPQIGGWGVHASKIRRLGIPILTSHTIKEAFGDNEVKGAVIARVGQDNKVIPETERTLEIDTICIAVGLSPMAELAQSAGCQTLHIAELGGWTPIHNERMETTIKGIYVAGDVCGVEEASTAMEEGKISGIAAAESLRYLQRGKAKELMKERQESLNALRAGPFATQSKLGKEKLIERFHKC